MTVEYTISGSRGTISTVLTVPPNGQAALTITGPEAYVRATYNAIVFGIETWDESELTP